MAVPSSTSAIRYVGNGSTVTEYSIPFPFLDTDHIYAAVSSDGEEDAELLDASDFIVTRLADGSGGTLTTVAAVTSPAEIVILRQVPLTQPTEFQPSGLFPARSAETALDRLEMQIQQLNRRLNVVEGVEDEDYTYVPSGGGTNEVGNATWTNAAARAAKKPQKIGQIGVETSTQTVWIAQSTTTGDWTEFQPRYSNRVVIGLLADTGQPCAAQTAAAALLTTWEVDAAIFAGDNNYNGAAGYTADWAAFASIIADAKAYPALGNHDLDTVGYAALHAAKFPYLPGNKRYYTKTLGGGLVDLFVLNSGVDSAGDLLEADGNTVGSTQHTWFVAALAASKARWKIAVFHYPPITLNPGETRTLPAMAWPELKQMDLVCCGHTHVLEVLKWEDVMLVNLSASIDTAGTIDATLQDGGDADAWLWANEEKQAIGRIVASEQRLTVEVWDINLPYGANRLLHIRDAREFQGPVLERETFTVIPAETEVTTGTFFVGIAPTAMRLWKVLIGFSHETVEAATYTLFAGEAAIAEVVVGYGITSGPCSVPDSAIPAGTVFTISTVTDGGKEGLFVTLEFERFS